MECTLPQSDLVPYAFQVAGHKQFKSECCAMLHSPSNRLVFKYILDGTRGAREVSFYEFVNSKRAPEELRGLRSFIPQYHGVFRCPITQANYLALSDMLAHLKRPSVCDVKLGTVSYRPDAAVEKKLFEDSKYKWQRTLGFILSGFQVYDPQTDEYVRLPKAVLRSFSPHQIQTVVLTTFLGNDPVYRRRIASQYAEKLSTLLHWFETTGSAYCTFCRSSVLLAHDTSVQTAPASGTDVGVVVSLIDFTDWAPVTTQPPAEPSDNPQGSSHHDLVIGFSRGLGNLIQMLKRIAGDTFV